MPLVTCPTCGHEQIAPREMEGLRIACRRCGKEVLAVESRGVSKLGRREPLPWITVLASIGLITVLSLVVGLAFLGITRSIRPDKTASEVSQRSPASDRSNPAVVAASPRRDSHAGDARSKSPAQPPRGTPTFRLPERPAGGNLESSGQDSHRQSPPKETIRNLPAATAKVDAEKVTGKAFPPDPTPEPANAFPQSELRPKRQFIPGYYRRSIHGFTVIVSQMAYDKSDDADRRPIGYLESEFGRLENIFPKKTLAVLSKVPIWVEWDHTVPGRNGVYGAYYGGTGEGLAIRGVDPRKAKCVCILSLKTAYELRMSGKSRLLVILHELAHAAHDQILGPNNPFIENAYDQAMTRNLYRNVRHLDLTLRRGYAATNSHEYFAELTCAYLDGLDYTPMNRDELKEYDSVGYELMVKVWGRPEAIEARKKRDRKKSDLLR